MKKIFKSGLSLLLALTFILSSAYVGLSKVEFSGLFAVEAKAASVSDLTFKLNADGMSYSVTDCNSSATGEIVIPSTYDDMPVTSIGGEAFYNCTSLTSVAIPDSLTNISWSAFNNCTSLTSVTIPDSVTTIGDSAFSNCTSLTSVTIGDGVTNIDWGAFSGCTSLNAVYITDLAKWCNIKFNTYFSNPLLLAKNLYINGELATDIVIPDSVTSIGYAVFSGCTSLTSVAIPDSVTSIGDEAFYNCTSLNAVYITDLAKWCNIEFADFDANPLYYAKNLYINGELVTDIVIPDSVTDLRNYVLYNCDNLMTVVIPDSVTNLGDYAFSNCDNLVSVSIGNNVKNIGESAFSFCLSLIRITIPDSVTSIGDSAFYNCTSLISITIPNSVTSIGDSAFYLCKSLTSVTIGDSVTSIGDSAFRGCTSLTSITIPDSVTSIDDYTFYNCTSLASATIGGGVTSIGYEAFYMCTSLTSITIPNSVKSIDHYAFSRCSSLESITIPDSVISIGSRVFEYCNKLTSVSLPRSLKILDACVFEDCGKLASIEVDENNSNFTSVDGVLYNKDKTLLIKYPSAKLTETYVIPDSVKTFSEDAFQYISFRYLVLSKGISNIPSKLFEGNSNIKSVYVPLNIKTISNNAFNRCSGIVDVYYEGTQEQWNSISVAANNSYLTNARIHYGISDDEWETHYSEFTVTTEPTCQNNGEKTATCSCGYENTESIKKVDHVSSDWIIEYPATCYYNGHKIKKCIYCSRNLESEIIPNIDHVYSTEWTIDVAPTCASNGSKSHHCINCGDRTDVTVIEAAGQHISSSWIVDSNPTCTTSGSEHKECIHCGTIIEYAIIQSTGHKADEWVVYWEASSSSNGIRYQRCSDCNELLNIESIPQLKCSEVTLSKVFNVIDGVKVEWTKVEGADYYRVYRKVKGGSYKEIGETSKAYFTDTTAKSGTVYYYSVRAINEAGLGATCKTTKSIKCLADPTLKVPTSSRSGITLKWTKTAGASGYIIYRKAGNGSYKKLVTEKGVSNLSYIDKTANKGTTYTYKIRAYYGKTYSAYSNTRQIKDKY